jgi:hypothetical protein
LSLLLRSNDTITYGRQQTVPESALSYLCDSRCQHFGLPNVAFPYDLDPPALRPQFGDIALIALDIAGELGVPIGLAALRRRCEAAARMLVPEAAVDEDRQPVPRQNQVWPACKVAPMHPILPRR